MVSNLNNVLSAYADGKIFGEPYGKGPFEVVFLHGWGRRGADFAEVAQRLADQGISSVALDLPGFGASPLPTVAGGAHLYANLVLDAIVEISSTPVVLVGHSFGGRVCAVLAAEHPEIVKAVLFTGVPLVRRDGKSSSPLAYRVVRFLHAKRLISDQRMEAARQKYGSRDYRNATGILRDVLVASVNESYEEELKKITVPSYFVWGANDTDVPLEVANSATQLVGGPSDLEVYLGVGHLTPTEAAAQLALSVAKVVRK